MSSEISPKAEVSPKAKIGDGCKIFPFVYIEDDVVIGDNCIVFPFVSILNGSRIGNGNKIHQCSVIGALPQDFNFVGEKSECVIDDNNIIRENVVINRATHRGCQTVIGSDNFLMEGVHISHDTKVGNHCIFSYGTKIAGDCEVADRAIYSSGVIQKARTRVGTAAYITAGTTFARDVPPYIVAGGSPVAYEGVNTTICREMKIDEKVIKHIANAYRLVFHGQTSVFDACIQVDEQVPDSPEIRNIVEFIRNTNEGIIGKL
ncbi:acyl-ACP--UDP-N-acetylglucosamine O-acyltransferase [Prevotella intermedia]|uniref:Acyl-ACP--UDP-N-acetylglucosamine O-acyltransferase n=1 Tax=Prevotella intermedia TaxID=28131 RepID=A0AAJ3VDW6_PREIN|nr:acyl-ACP--UDP-N-acetylglucosamine O-acyltransferase [Prevotella intermedia]PJI19854.1 acyl-ACP--UDP-N-acetylglucosamine O-acyltransferase [Prevotella intermedia]